MKKSINIPLVGGAILIVVLGVGGVYFALVKPSDNQQNTSSNQTSTNQKRYVDGTYEISSTYISPGGLDKMNIQVIIQDDKIASINIASDPSNNRDSLRYQNSFKNAISSRVVGKSLDNVIQPSSVSGASLTTEAFNKALEEIKLDAKI